MLEIQLKNALYSISKAKFTVLIHRTQASLIKSVLLGRWWASPLQYTPFPSSLIHGDIAQSKTPVGIWEKNITWTLTPKKVYIENLPSLLEDFLPSKSTKIWTRGRCKVSSQSWLTAKYNVTAPAREHPIPWWSKQVWTLETERMHSLA